MKVRKEGREEIKVMERDKKIWSKDSILQNFVSLREMLIFSPLITIIK